MIVGLRGQFLPENFDDFVALERQGQLRFMRCFICKKTHGPQSATTDRGWQETQISGSCEPCFDKLFAEVDDEPETKLDDGEGF